MSFWGKVRRWLGILPDVPPPPTPIPTPIPPPVPVPPPPTQLPVGIGYFYGDGRYGDYWNEWSPYCDTYHSWAEMAYWKNTAEPYDENGAGWKYTMRRAVRRAHAAGKRIILALDVGRNDSIPDPGRIIAMLAPFWDRVWLVDLFVECDWSAAQADAVAAIVRLIIKEQGLEPRPLGITLEVKQALTSDLVNARSIDWWGVELYVDPSGQNDPAGEIAQRIKAYARKVAARVPGKGLVFVGQSYDRNGAWKNIESLIRIQRPTYDVAVELKALALVWFAYGRPGGAHDHKQLIAEHKKIAALP